MADDRAKILPRPTPARVRAILKRAGYGCYKRRTTAVPGWYHYDRGYRVGLLPSGAVTVCHQPDVFDEDAIGVAAEAGYRAAIEAAGYRVRPVAYGFAVEMPGGAEGD